MAMISNDSGERNAEIRVIHSQVKSTAAQNEASASELTFCIPAIRVVLRKLLQIVF